MEAQCDEGGRSLLLGDNNPEEGGGGQAAAYLVSLCCSWDFNWTPLQIHTLCSRPLECLIPTRDTFKFAPLTIA
jgi:hypothetical protein